MSAIHKMEGDLTTGQLSGIFAEAQNTIDEHVAKVIKETAGKIAATQKSWVPKRTGKTQRSIKATGPGGAPFTKTTLEAEIGPTWFVGKLLELGTSTMAPQPFVEGSSDPHLTEHIKKVQKAMTTGALKGIA